MKFIQTDLKDAYLVELEPRGDDRGFFARTMCREEFSAIGIESDFVQQNTSFSAQRGTLRGLHFQKAPHGEDKLIRCISGAIIDVIVDIRQDSPTYMQHQIFELTSRNRMQLFVPKGFAHSFMTLTDNVEVSYLVTAPYTPSSEDGLRYDDEVLGIEWPLPVSVISDKDAGWPLMNERTSPLY
ncbi:dTDP-4-dehydrorhamnose 3,5-epimerase [Billgrantia bachuensis]|uniref:dTDP-4-dehydrorhamnose 3,5-epimerase n=1 Tax=Billgrantia bachuensis TaxID=2717286 RepID=A0ABX0PMR4_9GAMM|nr:dTDP-4-dehydrorhamnose 3,5-epimerase [Halomonas bachuensis]NIC04410.1 dTDP-4-dehydrorhamnose 3,5-epimerase [Halomonas bachuensis]